MTIDSPPTSPHPYHRLDISAEGFWQAGDLNSRDATFAELRKEPGLSWQPPVSAIFPHEETGYWAITRNADIREVSQNNSVFGSSLGVALDPMPAEIQRMTTYFLSMDPPDHTRNRRLISSTFTPRQVKRIEAQIKSNAVRVVDELLVALRTGEPADFVATCSAKLPMKTISDMIGIEPADQEAVAYAAESLFSSSDDEYASLEERAMHVMGQLGILQNSGIELAKLRREDPREDLMTNIVNAEVDGHKVSDNDIGSLMVLLASAGNDTTKQTTTHVFKALVENPDQRAWLLEDFDGRINTAVDEFVRWATPVVSFARHALVDTELSGTPIAAGEKLGMFYCSANRDEEVFDRPHEFDITRSPNPHVGFGGGGAHFCLGAQLAKMELRHLFFELLTRVPAVTLGEPEYLNSNFVNGIKRMSVSLA